MKSRYRKRTRLPYRRKRFTKRLRRGSKRNIMQKQESAGVLKKYTTVFTPSWQQDGNNLGITVSLCGGKKPLQDIISFGDVNPDGQTVADMKIYLQFCIYGCKVKLFFAMPTTEEATPVLWSMAYSPNILMNQALDFDRMQSLASYLTGPCNLNRSVSRYYALGYTKKKLGIDFDSCDNYPLYGLAGGAALYNGQLPIGQGPSMHFKIFRNSTNFAKIAARVQVTYYVKYRGTKGTNTIG